MCSCSKLWLLFEIDCFTLGRQLWLTFIDFLSNILLYFLSFGKRLSINARKAFVTFVTTLILWGGLKPGNFPFSRLSTFSKNAQMINEACPPCKEILNGIDATQMNNLIYRPLTKTMKPKKRGSVPFYRETIVKHDNNMYASCVY